MNPPTEIKLRHVCHKCGRGRTVSYTAKPWRGPCHICRSPIVGDRILTDDSDNIDTMTDDEVKSELDLRGINFLTSYYKMQTELLDRVQDRLKQRDEENKGLHENIARLKSIIEQYESSNNPHQRNARKTAILGLRERDE